jgi:hypothetical protein
MARVSICLVAGITMCQVALAQQGALLAQPATYQPLSGDARVKWFVHETIGPKGLLVAGPISAGWGTLFNWPREYGPHWDGFAKRYGMRLTGVSTGNAMEAGLGALWGEDPRYFRAVGQPFKQRVGNIMKMTFLARDTNGQNMPAYARYAATAGNNFLSNTWRAPSEATVGHATVRVLVGFLGRMSGNAFAEFWPDHSCPRQI